ncbi:hypothetical protein DRQ11_01785, partial [candidate division KSB1 bacterium]
MAFCFWVATRLNPVATFNQKPALAGFELISSAVFLLQRYQLQQSKTFTDKNKITMIFSKK